MKYFLFERQWFTHVYFTLISMSTYSFPSLSDKIFTPHLTSYLSIIFILCSDQIHNGGGGIKLSWEIELLTQWHTLYSHVIIYMLDKSNQKSNFYTVLVWNNLLHLSTLININGYQPTLYNQEILYQQIKLNYAKHHNLNNQKLFIIKLVEIDWLIDWLIDLSMINWSKDQYMWLIIDYWCGWRIYWLIDWSIIWSIDWSIG